MDTLLELIAQSGFRSLSWQNMVMFVVAGTLMYLAVKKDYEPLLLIPIGFGAMLANLPEAMLSASSGYHAEPGQTVPLFQFIYSMGIKTQLLPPVIFLGVGALTDFRTLMSRPIDVYKRQEQAGGEDARALSSQQIADYRGAFHQS